MDNNKNKFKGWLISLLVLLVLFSNISNVKALDNNYLEETNLTEIEEIIVEDTLQEEVVEEKTKEEIFTENSINLDFKNDEVIVEGNINELTTVGELLNNINIDELINNYSIEKVTVTNEEDVLLASTDYITNKCYLIIISNEYIANYKISFLGDLNQDNLVNDKDIEAGIEDFFKEEIEEEAKNEVEDTITEEILLEVKDEEVLSKEDDTEKEIIVDEEKITEEEISITEEISYIDAVIKNDSYEVEMPIQDEEINVNLEATTKEEIYVDTTVTVELSLEGFVNNYTNTISGNVEYDNEILELENIYITVDNKVIGKYINNKFIYILDNYHETKPLLLIIFKSIKEGTTNISINNLKVVMNGTNISVNNNASLNITVLEIPKGGDSEIESPPVVIIPNPTIKPTRPSKPITNIKYPTPTNKVTENTNNEPIQQLSEDNYIKNIEITNYEILFDKDINKYLIEVDNDINDLDLNITLNDENSTFTVRGNENFIPGKNEIIITVKSQKGETRDYIIEVNKKNETIVEIEEEKIENTITKEEVTKEKQTKSKTNYKQVIHILTLLTLIIIIIVLIYKLLKKED